MEKCEVCGKSFETFLGLMNHIKFCGYKKQDYYDTFILRGERGKCPICGDDLRFINAKVGYSDSCSKLSCIWKLHPESLEQGVIKYKQTCLEKYGVDSFSKTDKGRKQISERVKKSFASKTKEEIDNATKRRKETKLQKYGDENYTNKEKRKQTMIEKYGVEYTTQSPELREKIKETKLIKYGDENFNNYEKAKLTNLERYGVANIFQRLDIRESTSLEKYGTRYWFQSEEGRKRMSEIQTSKEVQTRMRDTVRERYGVDYVSQSEEVKNKKLDTRKRNKTFNTSKYEKLFYKRLCDIFSEHEIIQNYKSDIYPFACDFYVKHLKLHIELNIHWTHGNHWFNRDNIEDIAKLSLWEDKAKTSNFYKNAIITWTQRDVEKREIAKRNNLNYVVLWTQKDIEEWFNLGLPIRNDFN